MADRSFHRRETQGARHVEFDLSVIYAAGAPKFVEGDTPGAISGSYFSMVQSGAGLLTITTVDKYPGCVTAFASRFMVTPNGNSLAPITGVPTQNANGTWSVAISTAVNAAGTHTATTPANADGLHVKIVMRNSTVLP